ncbi:hypothetical protein QAD02_013505 [Eretmocerus hayati]|uniref:Uncharacterized protein n=1 Tax=Eretmocerus hayati TaxID=131215 RepID=A0ACC2P3N9_9HYME|nr:hypothetical protein QAD02_013505 [Eretmocerus hayati]
MLHGELVSDASVLIPETVYDSLQLFLTDTFHGGNIALAHDGCEECPDEFLVIDEWASNVEHVNGRNKVIVDGIDVFEAQLLSYVDNAVSNSSQQNHVDGLSGISTSHHPFDKFSGSNVATRSSLCTCKYFEASADITTEVRVGQGSPKQDAAVLVYYKSSVLIVKTDQ